MTITAETVSESTPETPPSPITIEETSGGSVVEEAASTLEKEPDAPEKPACQMQFTIGREALLDVLSLVTKAASQRTTLPVLSHVLIATHPAALPGLSAQAIFTCSNQETLISAATNVELVHEGSFTVPIKPFLECVKNLPKGEQPITIEVIERQVHIRCGKRLLQLKGGMDADTFPREQEMVLAEGAPFELDAQVLREAIKEVAFVSDAHEPRPIFTAIGLHVERQARVLELIAIDGFRMALQTITLPTIQKHEAMILVPATSLRILATVLPEAVPVVVTWDKDKTQATFQAGRILVWTRLVEGKFPKYRAIIPKVCSASFTVPRKDLDEIVKAFKIFAQDNANIFKLSYNPAEGGVTCRAESEDLGSASDELDVPVEGKAGSIIFNIRYLIELLKNVPTDAFTFKINTESSPGLIIPAGRTDHSYVLMPMSKTR